ncbi:hypothetical protein, partial [Bacteroides sp.]|uniref:hypothetical protein n=1 Tax=Bacteroides sp. TaxID=29523 RepID=UPI001B453F2A
CAVWHVDCRNAWLYCTLFRTAEEAEVAPGATREWRAYISAVLFSKSRPKGYSSSLSSNGRIF